MAIGAVGGVGGLSGLAELYRQQVLAGTQARDASSTGPAAAAGPAGTAGTNGTAPAGFGGALADGISALESLDRTASAKGVQAATGDLTDVHDYVIAATQAQVATELTTTVRNKALEAFNEIMRMPL